MASRRGNTTGGRAGQGRNTAVGLGARPRRTSRIYGRVRPGANVRRTSYLWKDEPERLAGMGVPPRRSSFASVRVVNTSRLGKIALTQKLVSCGDRFPPSIRTVLCN